MSRLGPLSHREFRLLFLGRAVSFFGNAMAPIALAFAVLDLTGSKSDLGLILAARTAPQVVFLLLGGIWADRLPRHHVMVGASVLSAGSQGAVAALLVTHHAQIWHLAALSAVNGISTAFFFPASAGIIPQTVDASLVQQANSLLRMVLNASWVGGAALGGILVAAFGPGWAVAVDASTFAASAVLIGLMRIPSGLRMEGSTVIADLREGWQEFRSRTWLWVIVVQFSIVNAAQASGMGVLGPVIAKRNLGGAAAWGAILTCQTVGLVLGGLLMLRARPQRPLIAANLGMLVACLPIVLLGGLTPTAVIAAGALVAGIGIESFSVLWDTAMQQHVPQEKLSRVYSYDALGSFALIPLAQAAIGPIAETIGTRATLFGAAGLVVAPTLAVLAVPDVRRLRRKEAATP
jgi:MFS family permease